MRLLDHIRLQDLNFTVPAIDESMIAEAFRMDPFSMATVTSWEVTRSSMCYHFQNVEYDPVCAVFKVEDGKDLLILAELLSYVCPQRLRVITDLPFDQVKDAIRHSGIGTGKQMIHRIRGEEIYLAPAASYIQFDMSYFENPVDYRGALVFVSEGVSGMSHILPMDRTVYIANRITLTYEYEDYGDEGHSISSLLRTGKGVCQAIASLFNESLISAGIPSRVVVGTMKDERGKDMPHAWNMCKIGDEGWMHIDLTAMLGSKISGPNDLRIKRPLLYRYNAEVYSDDCSDMMWEIHEAVKSAKVTGDDAGCIAFGPLKL